MRESDLTTLILTIAHGWKTDVAVAMMALPLDHPRFDAAFRTAWPAIAELLEGEATDFMRDVYWTACSEFRVGPRKNTSRRSAITFVPFVDKTGDLRSVIGDDERVLPFSEAYEASGYGGEDGFTLFFPRPLRLAWMSERGPGELRALLRSLVATLETSDADQARVAAAREAIQASLDPDGAKTSGDGEPCIRALLGLHVGTIEIGPDDDDDEHDANADNKKFITLVRESHPALWTAGPGEMVQTMGRMTVMGLFEQWLKDGRAHGLTVSLGPWAGPDPRWAEPIRTVHIYSTGTEMQVIAEMERTLLGPVAIDARAWALYEPELSTAIEAITRDVRRHDRPFALPRGIAN